MTNREIAENGLIVLATVGSTAHGLNLPGADDHDMMGVCIEPPSHVIGLRRFEQDVFRTQSEGVRSGPGDIDRVIYSARKFCRLALGGNPSILTMLFAPPAEINQLGRELLDLAPAFQSRRHGKAFLGYMMQQRERLLGQRGQMNVKRPDLVAEYGYDTKYAMHMLRLGFQGVEYLQTGRLSLPMTEPQREFVFSVRRGEVDIEDVLFKSGELEARLVDLLSTSPLPGQSDADRVNEWLVSAYQRAWRERRSQPLLELERAHPLGVSVGLGGSDG